jgi:hypothetical protein
MKIDIGPPKPNLAAYVHFHKFMFAFGRILQGAPAVPHEGIGLW